MKKTKSLFAVFLSIVIVLAFFPSGIISTKAETTADGLSWTYDLSTNTLTISGIGEMGDYSHSYYNYRYATSAPWREYYNKIKTIVINPGVTNIGSNAFYGCETITNIEMPDSVTSIGWGAFSGCTGLTSITIPDSVTSIGGVAFSGCYSLTSITIGNRVTSIGYSAFGNCTSLTNIKIPDSVTNIGNNAFYFCNSIEHITIPDSVTNIGCEAFSYCGSLTSVSIGSSVTNIGERAFSDCYSLSSIAIGKSVTSIGCSAFYNTAWYNNQPNGLVYAGKVAYEYKGKCPATVTIKDGIKGVAGGAFNRCTSLTSITIPDSVTNIGNDAFLACNNLQTVYFSGTEDEWDKIETGGFSNEPLLNATKIFTKGIDENINWEYDLKTDTLTISGKGEMNDYEDSAPFVTFSASAKKIVVRSGISSIGKKAFAGFSNVEKVVVPKSVKTIDSTSFSEIGENTKFVCSKGSVAEEIAKANMGEILTTAQPDLNGDEIISDKDAEKLLFHTFFPEEYNVDGYCDFDGDGEADTNDAVYILKHIYFPKFYPIA